MRMIKWISILLFLFCSSQLFAATCGDVNSDNTIDIVDALIIAQHYVGLNPANFDSSAADVNGDNNIDIVDALLVAQYYVGLINSFPGCMPVTIQVFDQILFYDGYAATVYEPVPEGVIRHLNSLYAKQLTTGQIRSIQSTLQMQVLIKAACDNYDRIGSVNLALVSRGSATYNPGMVQRLEIARFITPFMDKNRQPDTVTYNYEVNNLVPILKDEALLSAYDIWIELEVFGVPYAANTEIAGCGGRNDVFYGSLSFYSDSTSPAEEFDQLLPLAIKEPFNNYAEGASDQIGKTQKTITFTLESNTAKTQFVLITSNHGANSGGEEYNRRNHFVYFDGDLKLSYKPGRNSCEPFRQYNTQANGIYGQTPRTDAQWQSFSNWCPGDVIDIRIIELGAVNAGRHTFMIDVPDAVFNGQEGDIPLSLYLQAQTR